MSAYRDTFCNLIHPVTSTSESNSIYGSCSMGALAAAELAMLDVGIKVTASSGAAAASGYCRKHDRVPKKRVSEEQMFYETHSTGSIRNNTSSSRPFDPAGQPPATRLFPTACYT